MPGANPGTSYPAGTGLASPYQLALLAKQAGFPVSQIPTAVSVALAESSGRIASSNHNTNGTVDHGLWQINDVNLKAGGVASQYASNIDNPLANAQAAYAIWKSSGWGAWSTYNAGANKKYFAQAVSATNEATASTADQIAGALLPLAGIAAGVGLAGEAGAAGDAAAGGAAGKAGAAANAASKLAGDAGALTGLSAIAALLTSAKTWIRIAEIVGGMILIAMGLRSLTGSETLNPIDLAPQALRSA